ncbi:MAG: hypothetical protein FD161_2992 [Limisphaerales bacterium]|nr:MAG: hypothetical protein FD161_2992 [Limisphaerales bacterium]KAG0508105.1 MAG: hypothetical protein E1N63_2699 [Limisphaerales bacterium]TXT53042.1 MAG: hypothetical protein FD140_150 [Limisphaerales bacterium]
MDTISKVPLEYLVAALAVCFFVGLLAFILFAGSIAAGIKNIKSLFEQQQVVAQQVGPQPFEVKSHIPFATEQELKRVEGKVDKVEASLATLTTAISTNGEQRKAAIEGKVKEARDEAQHNFTTLNREVGSLKTAMELNTEHLVRIEEKIDRR